VDLVYDDPSNNFGFVAYNNHSIIVSFRGTVMTSLRNWIKNLEFGTMSIPSVPSDVQVHVGFYKSWVSLQSGIVNAVSRAIAISGLRKIIVTGHSLGGAIGTFAAIDLYSEFKDITDISLYTFGSPRVGNSNWFSYFEKFNIPTFRFVNNLDVVPHVPPRLVFDYHHVAQEFWYDNDISAFKQCDMTGEDLDCSDSIIIAASIDDHLNYFNVSLHSGTPYDCGGVTFTDEEEEKEVVDVLF